MGKNRKRKLKSSDRNNLVPKKVKSSIADGEVQHQQNPGVQSQNVDSVVDAGKWSKSKKKRMRKAMAKKRTNSSSTVTTFDNTKMMDDDISMENKARSISAMDHADAGKNRNRSTVSSMQEAFRARLAGSRFRLLNEELYTTTSQDSYLRFQQNPELFEEYHIGFRSQVTSWPENPVDLMFVRLKKMFSDHIQKSRRNLESPSKIIVADFGCGDAKLAADLLGVPGNPFFVHSFDLHAPNELVTACDMANVPLNDRTVDVCVFCLSLMGTNLADFLREAHRVLKDDGRVVIAEVRSRFEYGDSKKGSHTDQKKGNGLPSHDRQVESRDQGTLNGFIAVLSKLGFDCIQKDRSNTMFLILELQKSRKKSPDRKLKFTAKPCIYKRR